MPKLKVLSCKDVIKILESFGFEVVGQKGSHKKLRRLLDGAKQTLTVPDHSEIDRGTLKAIFNQSLKYVSATELRQHFYKE